MITLGYARRLRAMIEKAAKSLDNNDALSAVELYPKWKDGVDYIRGFRLRYNGVLYEVLQDHTAHEPYTPDTAISLYAEVLGETIKPWVQPGSTNGYKKGDKVYYPDWNDPIYESLYDDNIYSPEAWPQGWKQVSN